MKIYDFHALCVQIATACRDAVTTRTTRAAPGAHELPRELREVPPDPHVVVHPAPPGVALERDAVLLVEEDGRPGSDVQCALTPDVFSNDVHSYMAFYSAGFKGLKKYVNF